MNRSDYDVRKKRKGSPIAPILILALLFAVFVLLVGRFMDWWSWTPASAHEPAEVTVSTRVPTMAAMDAAVAIPIPTIAALSRKKPALAPEFILPDLFDESLNRGLVNYTGRPVILNFWASWCVPCKEEMPALQRAYEKYRDAGLIVLGLKQTFVDDIVTAREFVNELALTFPNVRDDSGNTSEGLYKVIGLPTSVFITPDGEISHKQIGQMTDEQIETFSQQLVAGEAITP